MEQLQQALVSLLVAVLTAVIGYVTRVLTVYLKEKGVLKTLEAKKETVDIVVNAIEQIYKAEHGADKIKRAKQRIVAILEQQGIKISETELETLIEASVKAMNDAYKGAV